MPLCHLCQHNQIDMRSVTDAGDVYFKKYGLPDKKG